jgi:uncharacterized protein with HEPN domain
MSNYHSDRARLRHVADAIELIFTYLEEDSLRGLRTRDAVIRQLEIIGEACNKLSSNALEKYSMIPWHQIIAMRNHLAHGYFNIDIKDVWDTVDNDLQPLHDVILVMLDDTSIS